MTLNDFKFFFPERPRLMHIDQPLFEKLDNDPDWRAELKYNGKRLELHLDTEGNFQFWNRHGERMNYVPDDKLARALRELSNHCKGYCIFDGELRHGKVKGVQHKIMLYDLLACGGNLLLRESYDERRLRLDFMAGFVFDDNESLSVTDRYPENFRQIFSEMTQKKEIEGIVIKNQDGMINLGTRGPVESTWMWKVRRPSNSYKF